MKKNAFNWTIDPLGLKTTLQTLYDRYHLPIIITENGLGAEDYLEADGTVHDPYRIDYLSQHISQCLAAINAGVDLIGYSPWSAIDLISVHEGIRNGMASFTWIAMMHRKKNKTSEKRQLLLVSKAD